MSPPRNPSLIRIYVEPTPSARDPPEAVEFYRALGMAIVAYGRLDGHFSALLLQIINLTNHVRVGRKFPMKWEKRREMWRSGFALVDGLKPFKPQADAFMDDFDILTKDRNNVYHCLWGFFRAGDALSINVSKIKASPGSHDEIIFGRGYYTVGWMNTFREKANNLNINLIFLGDVLARLRGLPPPGVRIL